MTAKELAALLHGRKVGKGKWVAKCPAHPDRKPSLSIAQGRKVPVLLRCMSQGCETKAILAALGLGWSALFDGQPTPEMRGILADERRYESLHRKYLLTIWLSRVEPGKRRYWEAASRGTLEKLEPLYWKAMPDRERFDRIRDFEEKDYRNKRLDWLARRNYGADGARTGTESTQADLRPNSIQRTPCELSPGGVQARHGDDLGHRGHLAAGD